MPSNSKSYSDATLALARRRNLPPLAPCASARECNHNQRCRAISRLRIVDAPTVGYLRGSRRSPVGAACILSANVDVTQHGASGEEERSLGNVNQSWRNGLKHSAGDWMGWLVYTHVTRAFRCLGELTPQAAPLGVHPQGPVSAFFGLGGMTEHPVREDAQLPVNSCRWMARCRPVLEARQPRAVSRRCDP